MTELRDASIGILLMRCGTWMVGVDALSVRAIRPPRQGDAPLDIGQFLRADGPLPPGDGSKRRVVELGGEGNTATFSIDNALGTRSLGLNEVRPLPPVLEHYGAPSWWLGTAEEAGELVLLIDLSALAIAARGTV